MLGSDHQEQQYPGRIGVKCERYAPLKLHVLEWTHDAVQRAANVLPDTSKTVRNPVRHEAYLRECRSSVQDLPWSGIHK